MRGKNMANMNTSQQAATGTVAIGGILIVLGVFFLLGQLFDLRLGHYLWPFFIIGPGLLLFIFALSSGVDSGEALAGAGSVVTMVGLILFYQNMANHFQSWAYAWALAGPTSVGLGQMVYGSLKDRPQIVHNGKRLATIGLSIFLVGAVFFELFIGISGFGIGRMGRYAWPIVLIGVGIFFILRSQLAGSSANQLDMVAGATDPTPELSTLRAMVDSGEMLEAEYAAQKAEILDSM